LIDHVARHHFGANLIGTANRADAGAIWIPCTLVFIAISFNFFLCFVNTNIAAISPAHLIGSELVIILMAFIASHRSIGLVEAAVIIAIVLYLLMLVLVRYANSATGEFDVKIIRDILIPIAFFLLGTRVSSLESVDKFVRFCAIVVSIFCVVEFFFFDSFIKYFDIISYYVSRGTLEYQSEYWTGKLFINSVRPEGRSLLPFLGSARISSIFLEPISPGNFAVILFFWAVVRSKFEKTFYFGMFAMAIFITVMADNRFGVYLGVLAVALSMAPISYLRIGAMIAPFAAMIVLFGFGFAYPDGDIDNSFFGRFLFSGLFLTSFDMSNWFGFREADITAVDSGYAYTISRTGILGLIALWTLLMSLKGENSQFQMYRAFCAIFVAAALCVSVPFSIKIASLLWFLLGVLSTRRDQVRVERTNTGMGSATVVTLDPKSAKLT
jgi:putative polymerase